MRRKDDISVVSISDDMHVAYGIGTLGWRYNRSYCEVVHQLEYKNCTHMYQVSQSSSVRILKQDQENAYTTTSRTALDIATSIRQGSKTC